MKTKIYYGSYVTMPGAVLLGVCLSWPAYIVILLCVALFVSAIRVEISK